MALPASIFSIGGSQVVKAALYLAITASLIAPQNVQRDSPAPEIAMKTTSRLVVVPAIIRSKQGELLKGLGSADFELTEDGLFQHPEVEQTKDKELAVVVVMQTGGGLQHEFQNYRTWNRLLGITTNTAVRKVALITFDSRPRQIWNFPNRWDGVEYALDRLDAGDRGAAILDALSMGLKLLQDQPPQMRRMLVLLSQSQDAGSVTSAATFLRQLAEANTTIYSVAFLSKHEEKRENSIPKCLQFPPEGQGAGRFSLNEIYRQLCRQTASEVAILSGGEYVEIQNRDDLDRGVMTLRETFGSSYTLTFRPASASRGFHFLSLRMSKLPPAAKMAFRRLYWVE